MEKRPGNGDSGQTFHCEMCPRRFKLQRHLTKHVKSLHGPLQCADCGKVYRRPRGLRSHRRSQCKQKKFECDECGRSFDFDRSLRQHVSAIHAQVKHRDDSASDTEQFEVEAILDRKIIRKKSAGKVKKTTLYYVKWNGYPSSQNSWEPESNLEGASDEILLYEAKH